LLTPWQKSWIQTRRFVSALKFETPAPRNKLRNNLFRLVHDTKFELFISCVIFANGLVMLLQSRSQSAYFDQITEQLNDIALFIFIVEMVLKIVALGPFRYFGDNCEFCPNHLLFVHLIDKFVHSGNAFLFMLLIQGICSMQASSYSPLR
jgi:hypothetical protein